MTEKLLFEANIIVQKKYEKNMECHKIIGRMHQHQKSKFLQKPIGDKKYIR